MSLKAYTFAKKTADQTNSPVSQRLDDQLIDEQINHLKKYIVIFNLKNKILTIFRLE